jgi:methylated-DNA-protein-cysteine methyltransferase-like protein
MPSDRYERIYAIVRRIPRGRVTSYGEVARLAGIPRHARQVGYALHNLSGETDVPWHRVLNAAGAVAKRAYPDDARWQRTLLEQEGVQFDAHGRVALRKFWWKPRRPR